MNSRLTLAFAAAITLSIPIVGLSTTPAQMVAYGQENATTEKNETINMTMMNTNVPNTGTIPSLSTPGEKTFYIFTSEVENVDENKLKVAGDSFSVHTLVTKKVTR